jgi:putative SOS response-associated peptidase YedK
MMLAFVGLLALLGSAVMYNGYRIINEAMVENARVSLKSGNLMAFAGIWETWYPKAGETVECCCIITTAANSLMAPAHDRMPVILDSKQWNEILSLQGRHLRICQRGEARG